MISVILIRAPTNQLEDLLPLTAAILQALETIAPGQTIKIPRRSEVRIGVVPKRPWLTNPVDGLSSFRIGARSGV
jgi:hypothetical protein